MDWIKFQCITLGTDSRIGRKEMINNVIKNNSSG